MKTLRAYRHKVRFTSDQDRLARQYAGCTRLLYNAALEHRRVLYKSYGVTVKSAAQDLEIKAIKKLEGFEFLADAPHHTLQQTLKDLDKAYVNFFKGRAKYPTPKRRGGRESFRFPDPLQIKSNHPDRQSQISLPKLGWVSVINAYPGLGDALYTGEMRSVTVSREADGWYVSILCEVQMDEPDWGPGAISAPVRESGKATLILPDPAQIPQERTLGIDLGVTNAIATSSGELIHLPAITRKEQRRLSHYQRIMARQQKRSNNHQKTAKRIARLHKRIRNRLRDAAHKQTLALVEQYDVIAIEDLKLAQMTKSAKGTVEEPGKNVRQKAGLNRAMLAQAHGEIKRQLQYKGTWHGCHVELVNPAYTSQCCQQCGYTDKDNRNKEDFRCTACGHEDHADVNAARNILARGVIGLNGARVEAQAAIATSATATAAPAASPGTAGTAGSGSHPIPNACNAATPSGVKQTRKGSARAGHRRVTSNA